MAAKISVYTEAAGKIGALIETERMPLALAAEGEVDLRIVPGDKSDECTLTTLHDGGWIACLTAHKLAEKLGIETRAVGKIVNTLDIKIKACELGCF